MSISHKTKSQESFLNSTTEEEKMLETLPKNNIVNEKYIKTLLRIPAGFIKLNMCKALRTINNFFLLHGN